MPSQRLADEALAGFAKGALYDQHRPSYSPEVVEKLLAALQVSGVASSVVLDLAAGTGKFTELLARREENFTVVAVEPHDRMRQELETKALPNVTVKSGLASSIPLQGESVDAVIAAQAFHWFANLESLKEIHRILTPSGSLGMIWNIEDYNQVQDHVATNVWESKLHDFIWSFPYDAPRFRHGEWKNVFEDQVKSNPLSITVAADPLFSLPLGEEEIKWTVWMSRENIWKRFRTLGQIAVLEGAALKDAKKLFDEALAGEDVEENDNGEVALHGVTYLVWTSKVPT